MQVTSDRKVWHPEVHRYYGRQLRFLLVSTELYLEGLRPKITGQFPEACIYEVLGRTDLIIRTYADQPAFERLRAFLDEAMSTWGTSQLFTVSKIHRVWGCDVPDDTPTVDTAQVGRIDKAYPGLSDEDKGSGLVLGLARGFGPSEIRAVIIVRLQRPTPESLQFLTRKIVQDPSLKSKLFGVYEGASTTLGLDGHLYLELALLRFRDFYPTLQYLHHLAENIAIKTNTLPLSYTAESGDPFSFQETPEILVKAYVRRFPELASIPAANVLGKIAPLDCLRPWWSGPPIAVAWVDSISRGIILEDSARILGPVSEISKRLEGKVKARILAHAQVTYGASWVEESTKQLQLKVPLTKCSLGQLLHAARLLRPPDMPVKMATLERFVDLRNAFVHENPQAAGQPDDFEEMSRRVPKVIAALLEDVGDLS